MDKKPFSIEGHVHRWDGTRWVHAEEVCCKPEEPKPENPNEWTHKCWYLGHVNGKVTLTDRSLTCFLCGARSPGDAVEVKPWWEHEPSDETVGVWAHKHGRQKIIMAQWSIRCGICGANRPHTDYDLESLRPSDAVRVEPWWEDEPTDTVIGIIGIWGHKHGQRAVFRPHSVAVCGACGAERPHTDYDLSP